MLGYQQLHNVTGVWQCFVLDSSSCLNKFSDRLVLYIMFALSPVYDDLPYEVSTRWLRCPRCLGLWPVENIYHISKSNRSQRVKGVCTVYPQCMLIVCKTAPFCFISKSIITCIHFNALFTLYMYNRIQIVLFVIMKINKTYIKRKIREF